MISYYCNDDEINIVASIIVSLQCQHNSEYNYSGSGPGLGVVFQLNRQSLK